MSNTIYKLYYNMLESNGFAMIDYIPLDTVNSDTFFISHSIDSIKSNSFSIPFTVSVSKNQTPYINDEEMIISIREKIDFVASGKNYATIKNIGKDIGKEDYKDYVPLRQSDLPNGFIEIKGINE
jgi:hypothetical protein